MNILAFQQHRPTVSAAPSKMKLALPKFTATQATVLVAVIGALSAALVTVVSETLKSRAQTQLARSEFETTADFSGN